MSVDIVTVAHPKDFEILRLMVKYAQQNCVDCRNIYIVTTTDADRCSFEPSVDMSRVFWINETDVEPCPKSSVEAFGCKERTGWFYQQLLKLNCDTIPGILDRIVIMDADTVLCKPCTFWHANDPIGYFELFDRIEPFYRRHIRRLLPVIRHYAYAYKSAVVHHMPIYKPYLIEMKSMIEQSSGKPSYVAFMEAVLPEEREHSGASEYQLYFDYCLQFHLEHVHVRVLDHSDNYNLEHITNGQYDMVSLHSYMKPS